MVYVGKLLYNILTIAIPMGLQACVWSLQVHNTLNTPAAACLVKRWNCLIVLNAAEPLACFLSPYSSLNVGYPLHPDDDQVDRAFVCADHPYRRPKDRSVCVSNLEHPIVLLHTFMRTSAAHNLIYFTQNGAQACQQ
jgi:hypothetical protein